MSGTYRLFDAAAKLKMPVPAVLKLTFTGDLELVRVGPHDALHVTRNSVKTYLAAQRVDHRSTPKQ